MHICVVGTGYVGLVTGACLADFGNNVTCIDKDANKIAMLDRGEMPIYEPGLDALVEKNVREGLPEFSTELAQSVESGLVVFIAVGTPPKEDGSADLSYVVQVAESIADNLNGYKVIVTKSTVPIGTGHLIEEIVEKRASGEHAVSVVSIDSTRWLVRALILFLEKALAISALISSSSLGTMRGSISTIVTSTP